MVLVILPTRYGTKRRAQYTPKPIILPTLADRMGSYIVDYDRLGTMKEDAIWYDHATTYTFWDVDERSEIDNDVSGDEEWFSCEEGPF